MMEVIEPSLSELVFVSFDGDIDEITGAYHGVGCAHTDNGCKYEGDFANGLMHGVGNFLWSDGVEYEGDFMSGEMNGMGSYRWPDGSTYEGHILDGLRHGINGVFSCSAGQLYDGEWLQGKRHGRGKYFYSPDCSISYTGDWVQGLRQGFGIMRYASGNYYEGEWLADKKYGRGVMNWITVDEVYLGDWINDKPHGLGEHIWGMAVSSDNGVKEKEAEKLSGKGSVQGVSISTNSGSGSHVRQICNFYRGSWSEGMRHGQGAFFYSDGSQYTGYWENNKKEGEGIFISTSGMISAGDYVKDRLVPQSIRYSDGMDGPGSPLFSMTKSPTKSKKGGLNTSRAMSTALGLTARTTRTTQSRNQVQVPSKLRSTDDVTPQVVLNLADVLIGLPQSPKIPGGTQTFPTQILGGAISDFSTIELQLNEIQRILLRYNKQTKILFKKYSNYANVRRINDFLEIPVIPSILDNLTDFRPDLAAVIMAARGSQSPDRYACIDLEQMIRLCRESQVQGPGMNIGLQEPVPKGEDSGMSSSSESGSRSDGGLCFFTVHNLVRALGDMRNQQRFLARKLQYQNRCERFEHPDLEQYFEIPENENIAPNKYISPDKPLTAYISRIHEYGPVDPGSKIPHDHDMKQPLLEREFVELLTRMIIQQKFLDKNNVQSASSGYEEAKDGNGHPRSVSPDYPHRLTEHIAHTLASQIYPLTTEDPGSVIPPFVSIFYSKDVNIMMRKKRTELVLIWSDIVQIALKNGVKEAKKGEKVARLEDFIFYLIQSRDVAIRTDCTTLNILYVLLRISSEPHGNGKNALNESNENTKYESSLIKNIDVTFVKQIINYEDFVFFLCKFVLSKYWIFKRSRLNETKSTVEDEIRKIDGLANANKLLEIEKKAEIEKKLEEEREKEKEIKEKKNEEKDRKKSASGERKIEKKEKDDDRPKSPAKRTAAQIKIDAELVLQESEGRRIAIANVISKGETEKRNLDLQYNKDVEAMEKEEADSGLSSVLLSRLDRWLIHLALLRNPDIVS